MNCNIALQDHYTLSKIDNHSVLSGPPHTPKNSLENNISVTQHPPKVKSIFKCMENTTSYHVISDPLIALKSSSKPKKVTRLQDNPMISVQAIPARVRWQMTETPYQRSCSQRPWPVDTNITIIAKNGQCNTDLREAEPSPPASWAFSKPK